MRRRVRPVGAGKPQQLVKGQNRSSFGFYHQASLRLVTTGFLTVADDAFARPPRGTGRGATDPAKMKHAAPAAVHMTATTANRLFAKPAPAAAFFASASSAATRARVDRARVEPGEPRPHRHLDGRDLVGRYGHGLVRSCLLAVFAVRSGRVPFPLAPSSSGGAENRAKPSFAPSSPPAASDATGAASRPCEPEP